MALRLEEIVDFEEEMITVPEGVKTQRYREMEVDSCSGRESLYGSDPTGRPYGILCCYDGCWTDEGVCL